MQIFFLDIDPELAALYLCDRHIISQMKECCQLVASAVKALGLGIHMYPIRPNGEPFKSVNQGKELVAWLIESWENWNWMRDYMFYLEEQYYVRYGKNCNWVVNAEVSMIGIGDYKLKKTGLTEFPKRWMDGAPATLNDIPSTVEAYRHYYTWKVTQKPNTFVWNRGVSQPEFIEDLTE